MTLNLKTQENIQLEFRQVLKNGIATVSFYGIKEQEEYTFSFSTKTIASIPFGTKYIEDGSLAVGTEKIKQKGANGLKTETYITKMLNGRVISTKLLSRDTYDAMQKIILKGTKGATTTKPTTSTTPTAPTNPTTPTEPTTPTQPEKPGTTTPEKPTEPTPNTENETEQKPNNPGESTGNE